MGPITEKDVEQIITVIKTLREVVNEYGQGYVYQQRPTEDPNADYVCEYVHEGQPDCLAAKVLHRLGVPLEVMSSHEGESVNSMEGTGLGQPALRVLRAAQALQDIGRSWGVALQAAERAASVEFNIEVPQ